jgi:hypothetical protein
MSTRRTWPRPTLHPWFWWLCRHSFVSVWRRHRDTCTGMPPPAWIDHHAVYNYVTCARCGKVLNYIRSEQVYGE